MALTPKQSRFVAEYLGDLNACQAAIRAGYSARTAQKIGSENLSKPEVKRAIDEALARRAARVEVKADDVLRELLRLAGTDIGRAFDAQGRLLPLAQMPEDVRRAIASVEVLESDEGPGVVRKVKFWDKPRALELLGKHLRLFVDKVEHSASEDLAALLVQARARAAK